MTSQLTGILYVIGGLLLFAYIKRNQADSPWPKYYRSKGFLGSFVMLFIRLCYLLGWM